MENVFLFISLIVIFLIGLYVGKRTRSTIFDEGYFIRNTSFLCHLEQQNGIWYAYDLEDSFIGQSENIQELQENVRDKIKGFQYYIFQENLRNSLNFTGTDDESV